jgi:hypothetical protein
VRDKIHFGLEAEFLLADAQNFAPLWYRDVSFRQLDEALMDISLEGLPSLEGLSAEPPHTKLMPFIVEGYGIPDSEMNIVDAYPKGIEIRTPVCSSLDQVLEVYKDLHGRVEWALKKLNLSLVAISHHPTETSFSGPQNKRRHDFWMWAQEVMTTYGPDINVSFPDDMAQRLFSDVEDLHRKVNYYAPAMAALSLASPFYASRPWMIKGQRGKSYRTFKRSVIAPAIELHADENNRIEFKVFEMSRDVADFEGYFLLVLGLFLSFDLSQRASSQERIYDLGLVSQMGLGAPGVKQVLGELFSSCEKILPTFGFSTHALKPLHQRFERELHISDKMLEIFDKTESIAEVLRHYSVLEDSR